MPQAQATVTAHPRTGGPTQPRHRPGYRTSWQLARAHQPADALAHLALRTTSPVVLDGLALAATGGTLTADQVAETPPPRLLQPEHGAALALALAGLGRSVTDLELAADLYQELWGAGALTGLPAIHHQALAQSLFLSGRRAALRETLPGLTRLPHDIRHDLETDLANPHLSDTPVAPEDHARWETLLASRFLEAGLEPVTVRGREEHLFDRLGADTGVAGTAPPGPLVTVIMPCYRPDEGLLTSIASISHQTWGALEILVVDDASGPGHADTFDRAVASDERARLVRLDRNGGSYLARNAALGQARGEFITFQDADDWSHPRRIEQQVQVLLEDAAAPASRSLAVRARDDLTHQWFGYRSVRDNASSLMLRRTVIDRIGPFAPIRKGADSEYAERVTSLVGPVKDTGTPLAITRLRTGTLSRGDFTYQWTTPERLVFKGSYRARHRLLAASDPVSATGSAGSDDTGTAVADGSGTGDHPGFPVPRSFLRGLPHQPAWDSVPLAYLGDLSGDPTTGTDRGDDQSVALWDEMCAGDAPGTATDWGGTGAPQVGLWHLESPVPARRRRPEMHDAWFDRVLRSDGALVPLTRLEPVRVERLVVLDPAVLLLAGSQPMRVEVGGVEVRLSPGVLQPDASGLTVDLLEAADVCRALWSTGPHWVLDPTLDDAGRAVVRELVPGLLDA